jgi:hypothetical protein
MKMICAVYSKRLEIQTWNNLKIVWKLIKFIYRCSIRIFHWLLCTHQGDTALSATYAATVTYRNSLWPVKFPLDGTVASEVGIPGLSRILICRSRMEWGPGIWGAKELVLLVLSKPFALETPFCFDSDLSAIRGGHLQPVLPSES